MDAVPRRRARRARRHHGDRGRRRRPQRHGHGHPRRRPLRHRPAPPAPRPGRPGRRRVVVLPASARRRRPDGEAPPRGAGRARPTASSWPRSTSTCGARARWAKRQKGRNDLKLASLRRDRRVGRARPARSPSSSSTPTPASPATPSCSTRSSCSSTTRSASSCEVLTAAISDGVLDPGRRRGRRPSEWVAADVAAGWSSSSGAPLVLRLAAPCRPPIWPAWLRWRLGTAPAGSSHAARGARSAAGIRVVPGRPSTLAARPRGPTRTVSSALVDAAATRRASGPGAAAARWPAGRACSACRPRCRRPGGRRPAGGRGRSRRGAALVAGCVALGDTGALDGRAFAGLASSRRRRALVTRRRALASCHGAERRGGRPRRSSSSSTMRSQRSRQSSQR